MSLTLAFTAVRVSEFGVKSLMFTTLLAQTDGSFNSTFGYVLGVLNMVGLTLAFGGLLFAAVMFMMGQTERMIYGLVGAVVGGMAWIIVKTMFQGSGNTVSINMQNVS